MAEHAAQRHRQAVVDVDLVDHREVEVFLDDLRRDMRRQLRMPDHGRHRASTVTLVRRLEFRPRHDREGGDEAQAEGRRVVVVDEEDDVRLLRLLPGLGEVVTGENRLPIVFLGLAKIEGGPDGGYMRGVDR